MVRRRAGKGTTPSTAALPGTGSAGEAGDRAGRPVLWWAVVASGWGLWAAFPPLNCWLLGWVVPALWLYWIRCFQRPRGCYWALYLAGLMFWLPTLQGIRLPYWALYFGWIVLSAYLALYFPLWAAITRWVVLGSRWPFWVVAPISWTVLEWLRGQGPVGFSAALLAHSQLPVPILIQVSDWAGGYTVSLAMMVVAAAVAEVVHQPRRWHSSVVAPLLVLAVMLTYGAWRLKQTPQGPAILRAALLQANYDTVFEYNPERNWAMFEDYRQLAEKAAREIPDLQLIVWPESAFTENNPCWQLSEPILPPANSSLDAVQYAKLCQQRAAAFREKCRLVASRVQSLSPANEVWQIVGTDVVHIQGAATSHYNSALLLDGRGEVQQRYDKMHLVMFGEYLPFGSWFPWIYRWSPLPAGMTPGRQPVVFQVGSCSVVVNICFESTVPHLIRRHVRHGQHPDRPLDVIVNITHDGWFWGSSILDLHLACSAFRAVENRRPFLMAANPGITAWIDGNGRIVQRLPKRAVQYLRADVVPDHRWSLYTWWGDTPVVLAGFWLALAGMWPGRRQSWLGQLSRNRVTTRDVLAATVSNPTTTMVKSHAGKAM